MSELWQPWENLFLHEVGGTMPVSVIAEKLERSEKAIQRKAERLDVKLISRMTGRRWTKAELSFSTDSHLKRSLQQPVVPSTPYAASYSL